MADVLSGIWDNAAITAQDRPRRYFHLGKHCLVLFQSQVHLVYCGFGGKDEQLGEWRPSLNWVTGMEGEMMPPGFSEVSCAHQLKNQHKPHFIFTFHLSAPVCFHIGCLQLMEVVLYFPHFLGEELEHRGMR